MKESKCPPTIGEPNWKGPTTPPIPPLDRWWLRYEDRFRRFHESDTCPPEEDVEDTHRYKVVKFIWAMHKDADVVHDVLKAEHSRQIAQASLDRIIDAYADILPDEDILPDGCGSPHARSRQSSLYLNAARSINEVAYSYTIGMWMTHAESWVAEFRRTEKPAEVAE